MPFGIGLPELLVLLVVLLLLFGAKRLPEMGKSLGKGMREFKDAVSGLDEPSSTSSTPGELPPAASRTGNARESDVASESEREKVS